jgi:hypothetical protein
VREKEIKKAAAADLVENEIKLLQAFYFWV